jgi:NhaP-type Na+/H+ or K+/H+ antiporter
LRLWSHLGFGGGFANLQSAKIWEFKAVIAFTVFVLMVLLFGLVSHRLEKTVFTAPMVFTLTGLLLYFFQPGLVETEVESKVWLTLAEIALILVLFSDATRINLRALSGNKSLPVRLLGIGMPLTILLGLLAAVLTVPGLLFWEAAILAAILAPTDAGLGEMIVSSPRVPVRIRQALNVESGLNDGLSVPFLMLFIALAQAESGGALQTLLNYAWEQIGLGTLVGVTIGLGGGWLISMARQHGWLADSFLQLTLLALPFLCWLTSKPIGASPFIAAFVGGLVVRVGFKDVSEHTVEFSQQEGQLLDLFVFFLFGLMAGPILGVFSWAVVLYALLSLTVVRMLPVAISLAGTRLSRSSVLFMGWFGPRGLASIVLGLVFLEEEAHLPGEPVIALAVAATVLFSVLAHGISTLPGIGWYARQLEPLEANAPEFQEVVVSPT